MLRTAAGRCYLAHCTPDARARVIHLLKSSNDPEDGFYLIASWLDRMLSETLERGYAARFHEKYNAHTSSIAVPIFSGTTLVGSMAVIWITKALTLEEGIDQFLDPMREAARRITYRHDRMHADG